MDYNEYMKAITLIFIHSFIYFAYTTLHEMLLGTQGVGYIKTIENNKVVLIQENNCSLLHFKKYSRPSILILAL